MPVKYEYLLLVAFAVVHGAQRNIISICICNVSARARFTPHPDNDLNEVAFKKQLCLHSIVNKVFIIIFFYLYIFRFVFLYTLGAIQTFDFRNGR